MKTDTKAKISVPALSMVEHGFVREDRGLLPFPEPLKKFPKDFPSEFQEHNEMAENLPKYISSGLVRKYLDDLPPLPVEMLEGRYAELAFRNECFFVSAYAWAYCIWNVDAPHAESIPINRARTIHALAQKLGVQPILCYWMYAMNNFAKIDDTKPIRWGNISTLQNFASPPFNEDEDGFILPHVEIESEAGPGLCAIPRAQEAVLRDDGESYLENLQKMKQALLEMTETLKTIPSLSSPNWYFRYVRPWIFFFRQINYDGVGRFEMLKGETGAQSPSIISFDRALGVKHEKTGLTNHLQELRPYRPPLQEKWIKAVEQGPSLKNFILKDKSDRCIKESFNEANEALTEFRRTHFKTALMYIKDQGRGAIATGGTHYERFLPQLIKETEANMII